MLDNYIYIDFTLYMMLFTQVEKLKMSQKLQEQVQLNFTSLQDEMMYYNTLDTISIHDLFFHFCMNLISSNIQISIWFPKILFMIKDVIMMTRNYIYILTF